MVVLEFAEIPSFLENGDGVELAVLFSQRFVPLENAFVSCRLRVYVHEFSDALSDLCFAPDPTGSLLLDPAGDFRSMDPLFPPSLQTLATPVISYRGLWSSEVQPANSATDPPDFQISLF